VIIRKKFYTPKIRVLHLVLRAAAKERRRPSVRTLAGAQDVALVPEAPWASCARARCILDRAPCAEAASGSRQGPMLGSDYTPPQSAATASRCPSPNRPLRR
jgi:hypothetical protein